MKRKKTIKNSELKKNFGAAVIDMQKVLSKSTAWTSLQKQVKEIEDKFKEQIKEKRKKVLKKNKKILELKNLF